MERASRVRGGYSIVSWYRKRLKRIYLPYEIFLGSLAIIYLLLGKSILTIDWLWLVLGLQGSVVGVTGAGQTWFISALLFCYFITPLIAKLSLWLDQNEKWSFRIMCMICTLPLGLAFIPPVFVSTLFSPVAWYSLAYLFGTRFEKEKLNINKKNALKAVAAICVAFAVRIVVRMFADGTVMYDRVTVKYTKAIAAFGIFYIFAYLMENRKPSKMISFISAVSFEVYLYHYMFCVGPLQIFGKTYNWVTDCMAVVMVTFSVAFAMKQAGNWFMDFKDSRWQKR